MQLTFLGAAGTVTGSRHLLTVGTKRILVDCGLFQGLKALRLRNREPLPFDPAELDAVVLTHAHLDHSGFLPVLLKQGYRGPIHCTQATADLTGILLADSGSLQEEDARFAARKGFSHHEHPEPLYTEEEARAVSAFLGPRPIDEEFDLGGVTARFTGSGHILGAVSALVRSNEGSVLFSGDIGRPNDLLIRAPDGPPAADWVVMESTYGSREHPPLDPLDGLEILVRRTVQRGGVLMIPAFAVGRAQLILYALWRLLGTGAIPRVPIYLNSPMAIDVTGLYAQNQRYHRLSAKECAAAFGAAEHTRTVEESKRLNTLRGPMILVAGAGMLTGGRILHHLTAFGSDARNTILLAGHQAAGTRGADLLEGKGTLKIHGRDVRIRAEVVAFPGLSAHADQSELLQWIGSMPSNPRRVFLVHGEPREADALRHAASETRGLAVDVAQDGRTVTLD